MAIKASGTITLSTVIDVTAVYRYYLLQSSTKAAPSKPTTNPPGGSWVLVEPSYTSGSTDTLYFCDLTVFSDNTFNYSNVSISSAYEAAKAAWNKAQAAQASVDNLEIGGRNYLRSVVNPGINVAHCDYTYDNKTGTYTLTVTELGGSFQQIWNLDLVTDARSFAGRKVMVSCRGITTTDANADIRIFLYCTTTSDTIRSYRIMPGENVVSLHDDIAKVGLILRCDQSRNSPVGTVATFTGIKMELGDKATDWTPAPEDVDAATAEAQSAADAAQSAADAAQSTASAAQSTADSAQATADTARAEFRRVVRIDDAGRHVGDNQSNGEVLIDSGSVNVVINGVGYSKFAGNYVQFGDYQMRRSADGGLMFKRA